MGFLRNFSSVGAAFVIAGGALGGLATGACGDDGYKLGHVGTIEVTPSAIEFVVDRIAPAASDTAVVEIMNLGTGALEIRGLRLEAGTAASRDLPSVVAIETAAAVPFVIAPESVTITRVTLRYTRRDDLPRDLVLVIESSDLARKSVSVPVSIRRGKGALIANPARADYVDPGTRAIRLINTGNADIHVQRMVLDGDPAFAAMLGTQTIYGGSAANFGSDLTIRAGSETALEVSFTAVDARPYEGTVLLYGDSPNTTNGFAIPLTANHDAPCIIVNPPRVAFGHKPGDSVTDLSVELRSCGNSPLVVDSIALAGASDAADPALVALGVTTASSPKFELLDVDDLDPAHPLSLATNATHTFHIRYSAGPAPSASVAHPTPEPDLGTILIRSNALIPVAVVPVTATTDAAPTTEEPTVVDHAGCEWTGGAVTNHHVAVMMTADDAFEAWMNGTSLGSDPGPWSSTDTFEFDLPSGCHVLSVHAWDSGAVLSGLIAIIKIDGVVRWMSGDNKPEWAVTGPNVPPGDWHQLAYDDSQWATPRACTYTSPWHGLPEDLTGAGAHWVWWNQDCGDLTNAWFRLTFTVD